MSRQRRALLRRIAALAAAQAICVTTALAQEAWTYRAITVPHAHTESIYTTAWIDLKNGPPNTLGIVDDFLFRYVADLGNAGPDKGKGGKYLFLLPGYDSPVPAGYHVYRSPTFGNWFITRGFQVNGDPKPGTESIKANLRICPLMQAANPPPTNFVNVPGKAFNTNPRDGRLIFRRGE
jgi:hypothetical protein